jgi:hydrogenase maturation protease
MQTLIIGLGHPDRGDDAVGLIAAEALAEFVLDGTTVLDSSTGLLEHADAIAHAGRLIVVDAVRSGAEAGTIVRLSPRDLDAEIASFSSHGMGLASELALLDRIGRLPEHTVVLGMEIEDVALGAGLSRPVAAALPDLIAAALASHAIERTGDMPG